MGHAVALLVLALTCVLAEPATATGADKAPGILAGTLPAAPPGWTLSHPQGSSEASYGFRFKPASPDGKDTWAYVSLTYRYGEDDEPFPAYDGGTLATLERKTFELRELFDASLRPYRPLPTVIRTPVFKVVERDLGAFKLKAHVLMDATEVLNGADVVSVWLHRASDGKYLELKLSAMNAYCPPYEPDWDVRTALSQAEWLGYQFGRDPGTDRDWYEKAAVRELEEAAARHKDGNDALRAGVENWPLATKLFRDLYADLAREHGLTAPLDESLFPPQSPRPRFLTMLAAEPPSPAAAVPAAAAVRCSACSAPARPGKKFCGQCGTRLPAPPASCRACRAALKPGLKFCPACGASVGADRITTR